MIFSSLSTLIGYRDKNILKLCDSKFCLCLPTSSFLNFLSLVRRRFFFMPFSTVASSLFNNFAKKRMKEELQKSSRRRSSKHFAHFFFVYAVSFWIKGVARLFLVMNSRATFSFSLVNFLYVFHVLIRLKSNAFTRKLFRFVCELLVCMQTAVRSSKVENCWRQFSIFQIPSQAFNSFLDTLCSNAA